MSKMYVTAAQREALREQYSTDQELRELLKVSRATAYRVLGPLPRHEIINEDGSKERVTEKRLALGFYRMRTGRGNPLFHQSWFQSLMATRRWHPEEAEEELPSA